MADNDYSFLSEEERSKILEVLKREEEARHELDKQVEDTARRLKSIQKAARSANGCRCCGVEFGRIFNRGLACPRCNDRVCKSCRSKNGSSWECSKCSLNRELQLETGTWFYSQSESTSGVKPKGDAARKKTTKHEDVCQDLKKALEQQPSRSMTEPSVKSAESVEATSQPVQLDPDRNSLSSVEATPLHEVPNEVNAAVLGSAAISVVYRGGKVIVGVRELKGLANPRVHGLPNPYYRLYMLPDDEHATKRVSPSMRETCWPLFNSQFEFDVAFDNVFDTTLWLSVWDNHPSGSALFMGEVRLQLSRLDLRNDALLHYTLQNRNLDLEPPPEKKAEHRSKLRRSPSRDSLFSVDSSQSGLSKISGGSLLGVQGFLKMAIVYRANELIVNVDSAVNLANPHRLGNPDPYVKIYLQPDPKKATKRKTKAAKQTVDPKFHSTLTWSLPLEDVRSKVLHAAVYDHSRIQRNPFLGEVRLHLDSVNFEEDTPLEYGLCEKNSSAMADTHIIGKPAMAAGLSRSQETFSNSPASSPATQRGGANPGNRLLAKSLLKGSNSCAMADTLIIGKPAMAAGLSRTQESFSNSPASSPATQRGGANLGNRLLAKSHIKRSDSLGSFESVESTATTAQGGLGSARHVVVTGFITFGVSYTGGKLNVDVHRCIDLAAPCGPGSLADPYVKLYLLPDKAKATKRKTKAGKATLDPVYKQSLSIKMAESEVSKRVLWLSVWDNNTVSRNTFLGEVKLRMSTVTFAEIGLREVPLFDLHSPEISFDDMALPAADMETRLMQDKLLAHDDTLLGDPGMGHDKHASHSAPPSSSSSMDEIKAESRSEKPRLISTESSAATAKQAFPPQLNAGRAAKLKVGHDKHASHSAPPSSSSSMDEIKAESRSEKPRLSSTESSVATAKHAFPPQLNAGRAAKLKDADTCSLYSVGSVATVAPGAGIKSVVVTGSVSLALYYGNSSLYCKVKSCKGLSSPHSNGLVDPYVKVYILPDKSKSSKRKTRAAKKTTSPTYNEVVQWSMSRNELAPCTLWLSVWDNTRLGHNTFLGEVRLLLSNMDLVSKDPEIFDLQEKDSLPSNMVVDDDAPLSATGSGTLLSPVLELQRSVPQSSEADVFDQEPAASPVPSQPMAPLSAATAGENDQVPPHPHGQAASHPPPALVQPEVVPAAVSPALSGLKRSDSMSSLQSSISTFNNTASVLEVTGSITLVVSYSKKKLEVAVVKCDGLSAPPKHSTADPYVKAYLLPDPKKQTKKKTKSVSKSLSPHFNDSLSYKVSELTGRVLWLSVWDNARLAHNTFLGELRLDLNGADLSTSKMKTFHLLEKNSEPISLHELHCAEVEERRQAEEEEARRCREREEEEEERRRLQDEEEQRAQQEREAAQQQKEEREEVERQQLSQEQQRQEERQQQQQQQQQQEEEEEQSASSEHHVTTEPTGVPAPEPASVSASESQSTAEVQEQPKLLVKEEPAPPAEKQPASSTLSAAADPHLSSLKRSDSMYSVYSTASGTGSGHALAEVTGSVTLSLTYKQHKLEVHVVNCDSLSPPPQKSSADAYVKTYILPDPKSHSKKKTKAARKSLSPRFNETLSYKLTPQDLKTGVLWLSVWDNAKLGHNTFLGEVRLDLSAVDFSNTSPRTFHLLEKDSAPIRCDVSEADTASAAAGGDDDVPNEEDLDAILKAAKKEKAEKKKEVKKSASSSSSKAGDEDDLDAILKEAKKEKAKAKSSGSRVATSTSTSSGDSFARMQPEISVDPAEGTSSIALTVAGPQSGESEATSARREDSHSPSALRRSESGESAGRSSAAQVAARSSTPLAQMPSIEEGLVKRGSPAPSPRLLTRQGSTGSMSSIQSSASTYSVMTGKKVTVTGSITVGLSYKSGQLSLAIVEAKELASPHSNGSLNAYAKTYLLPDKSKETKRKTKSMQRSHNPVFRETITYKVDKMSLDALTAHFSLWDRSRVGHNTFLGEIRVPLYSVDLDDPTPATYVLREQEMEEDEGTAVGELVIGLRVVAPPASGMKKSKSSKLSVEAQIVSAANLPVKSKSGFIDPFVKCYLLPDTKNKQKTPTLARNNSPTWRHTMSFDDAVSAAFELTSRSLEVTVWDFDKRGSNDFLGGLLLGVGGKVSAEEKLHWQELMAAPVGQWVEKRHFLQMSQRR